MAENQSSDRPVNDCTTVGADIDQWQLCEHLYHDRSRLTRVSIGSTVWASAHSMSIYDGIFLGQSYIPTKAKVIPPAEDPIATPRMSQSEVTGPCSCDHALAKTYLRKCDNCAGKF
jgi:hypothetical protein